MNIFRSPRWGRIVLTALAAVALLLPAATAQASTHAQAQRRCTRDIVVTRYVGQTVASWTSKCVHAVQVFAMWNDGVTRFGAKVVTGVASVVNEPAIDPVLNKAICAGWAGYNSAGTQVDRVITYHIAGVSC